MVLEKLPKRTITGQTTVLVNSNYKLVYQAYVPISLIYTPLTQVHALTETE